MINLTSVEIRALTGDCPEIKPENCRPGLTPAEVRSLIAQTRAKALGPERMTELRSVLETQYRVPESFETKLESISLF